MSSLSPERPERPASVPDGAVWADDFNEWELGARDGERRREGLLRRVAGALGDRGLHAGGTTRRRVAALVAGGRPARARRVPGRARARPLAALRRGGRGRRGDRLGGRAAPRPLPAGGVAP